VLEHVDSYLLRLGYQVQTVNCRLFGPIGNIPLAEAEAHFYVDIECLA